MKPNEGMEITLGTFMDKLFIERHGMLYSTKEEFKDAPISSSRTIAEMYKEIEKLDGPIAYEIYMETIIG